MSCIIQILNQVVPDLSLNDAILAVCQQVVNIMKLRLESDLDSIIHNELDFDMDNQNDQSFDNQESDKYHHNSNDEYDDEHDDSTTQQQSRNISQNTPRDSSQDYLQLFHSILSDIHQFDLFLRQTWDLFPSFSPSAFLIQCFQKEEVFTYWLNADIKLYQDFVSGLKEDREAAHRFQLLLSTLVNRLSFLIGETYQIRYYQQIIQPLLGKYLAMQTMLNPLTRSSVNWEALHQLLDGIDEYDKILNDFAEHSEIVELFECMPELSESLSDIHNELSAKKRQVLDGLTSIFSTAYYKQVLDEILLTELFTRPSGMDFPHHLVASSLLTGRESLETSLLAVRQWCSPRIYRGVSYRVLRAIDTEVKERVQRVHYNQEGAKQIVKLLKEIATISEVAPAGLAMDTMKVGNVVYCMEKG